MRKPLILLFLVFALLAQGQSDMVDTLKARLTKNLPDTQRAIILNKLSVQLVYVNLDTAILLATEGLALSKAHNYRRGITSSISKVGAFTYLKGNYPKALEYFHQAIEIDKEIGDSANMAVNLSNVGMTYSAQGNYPKAMEGYFEALRIEEVLGRKSQLAKVLGNIAALYQHQKNLDKALEYHLRALALDEELDRKSGIVANLGNIGVLYSKKKKFSKALEYYHKALKTATEVDAQKSMSINLANIGNAYAMQGDSAAAASTEGALFAQKDRYPAALESYALAQEINQELGRLSGIASVYGDIGLVRMNMGDYEMAGASMKKGLKLAKEIGAKEIIKSIYDQLSQLHDVLKQPAEAFRFYKLYIIYRDSISNDENTKAETRTEMRYEYEKAELIAQQAEQEQRRKEKVKKLRRNNLQYSIILLCLLILVSLVLGLGKLALPVRVAEGLIFFTFLIFFEFLLVLADPYIEVWSSGAPGIKLLFNAGIAALIFPLHSFFESKLKGRLVKH